MIRKIGLEALTTPIVRMVENWGSGMYSFVRYAIGLEDWTRFPTFSYCPRPWSCSPTLDLRIDADTGGLRVIHLSLEQISLPQIKAPLLPRVQQPGRPLFDRSLWPAHSRYLAEKPERVGVGNTRDMYLIEQHVLSAGWTGPDEIGVYIDIQETSQITECRIDPTLSGLFNAQEELVGVLMRSFSRLDKLIIQQIEPPGD